jgi:DNA-binding IclR family transcriptional regulator
VNSLERMLSLLDVFTPAAPVWTSDDLVRYSGCTRSTCYRYIRVLQVAGLLAPVGNGSYILGPRIIELDRYIRMSDPVFRAGGPPMKRLAAKTGHSSLLCMLFSDRVMCVREELSPSAPERLFSRGQTRPLFAGAASKVILAHLPAHQLRRLFAKHRKEIAAGGLGADWDAFRDKLRRIRDDGYCMTTGEFAPGITGIAAPLFNRANNVLGSIGVAMTASKAARARPALVEAVVQAAVEATGRIRSGEHAADLPARAVGRSRVRSRTAAPDSP